MFDFLFNPQGRISRKGFWLGYALPYLAITILLSVLEGLSAIFAVLGFIAGLFYLWPGLVAVPVKRFHDHGMTGFWQLAYVGAGFVSMIVFFVGVGMHAAGSGRENELSTMSTLPEDEQMALLGEIIAGSLSHPAAIIGGLLLLAVNLVYLYFQGIRKGQAGSNQHGDDPLASGRGFAD